MAGQKPWQLHRFPVHKLTFVWPPDPLLQSISPNSPNTQCINPILQDLSSATSAKWWFNVIYLLYPSFYRFNIWEWLSNLYRFPNCLGNCRQGAWTLTLAFLKGSNHVPMTQGSTNGDKQLLKWLWNRCKRKAKWHVFCGCISSFN